VNGVAAKLPWCAVFIKGNQTRRLAVRKRTQKHSIDYAEDSCGCANAECQSWDRDGRKSRVLAQHSHAMTQVLTDLLDRERVIGLPNVNHVFLPGHRIMVQVQSGLFPLYDRNPQTFVPNIFDVKPGDYRKATQRVWHGLGKASLINLPVVPSE